LRSALGKMAVSLPSSLDEAADRCQRFVEGKKTPEFLALAGLTFMCHGATNLPQGVQKFIDTHVLYHGTPLKNAPNINLQGFKESTVGMLGPGLYATHHLSKAENYAGRSGVIYKITFESANVKVSEEKDRSWRKEGFDAIYTTAQKGKFPNKKPEMCINMNNVQCQQEIASKSITEKARVKIDEFFIKHPMCQKGAVYIAGAMEVVAAAEQGAFWGATIGGVIASLIIDSKSMTAKELNDLILEGANFGFKVGVTAGLLTFANVVRVGATSAAAYEAAVVTAGGAAALGSAVAFPVAFTCAAAWVIQKACDRHG